MRILWMSDSPASPTGLGNLTRFVCAGLARLGHQVSVIGWQTRGRPLHHRRYTVYPVGDCGAEAELLVDYLRRLRPDVLVTASDPWRVDYIAQRAVRDFLRDARILWACYYSLDSDMGGGRLPPSFQEFFKQPDLPIAMSRYARQVTRVNGVSPAYIPPGVETKLFRPPMNKTLAKDLLGYGGRFVVLSDARNQIRKMWPRALEVYRRFAAGKKDVLIHLHCDPYDLAAGLDEYCYDLVSDIEFLGLGEQVRFTRGMVMGRGISRSDLAALYRAADVHLLASYGEGFGLPTLQAAAAGVVPMAAAYSASRELVRGHGEEIRVRRFVRVQSEMRCALIDIDDAVGRLERLYRDCALLNSKSRAARRFAASYDWEHVVRQWHTLLQREVSRLRGRNGSRPRTENRRANLKAEFSGKLLRPHSLRDAHKALRAVSIPATPPPAESARGRKRVIGRIYLAGDVDVLVFEQLRLIFPKLTAWSKSPLDRRLSRKRKATLELKTVPAGSRGFRPYLASTSLALDAGGVDSALPVLAAEAGVPLVGLARFAEQRRLWPSLTLAASEIRLAAERCRWILTDHSGMLEACALAGRRRRRNAAL